MKDLTNPFWIKLKGLLFLFLGSAAAILIFLDDPSWKTAGLLALVVCKLLLIDMSNAQGWERIVTFIGVGFLMLVTGYFVPLPPKRTGQEQPA